MKTIFLSAAAAAAIITLAPVAAQACACGCGVFDVGTESMLPTNSSSGGSVWIRYDEMDQNQNWEGDSRSRGADNDDKDLRTNFYTVGGQYMINRSWMIMGELPTYNRSFTTTDDDGSVFGVAGKLYTGHITAIGDLQLTAMYTGLAPDMSTGVGFGVKLPTGDYSSPKGPFGGDEFDRDSLPGTGSTDLMISGYHVGAFGPTSPFSYFVQGKYQFAILPRDSYRPGNELDASIGVAYDAGGFGPVSKISPVLQLLDSFREHDSGANADPANSGYERLLISPGVDLRLNQVHLYMDVALPIYQHLNSASIAAGQFPAGQLAAPILYTVRMAYDF